MFISENNIYLLNGTWNKSLNVKLKTNNKIFKTGKLQTGSQIRVKQAKVPIHLFKKKTALVVFKLLIQLPLLAKDIFDQKGNKQHQTQVATHYLRFHASRIREPPKTISLWDPLERDVIRPHHRKPQLSLSSRTCVYLIAPKLAAGMRRVESWLQPYNP